MLLREGRGPDLSSRITVGVLTPLLSGHYFGGLLRGVARAAAAAGGRVVAVQTFDPGVDEIAYLDLSNFRRPVAWRHVAGFVVVLNSADRPYLDALRDAGKPVVMVSQEVPGFDCPVVLPDNRGGTRLAVEHLIAHGHRRIGFVGWMAQEDIRQRHEAYRETLAAHGLPYEEGMLFPAGDNVTTGGEVAAELMVRAGMPVTAAFCANDYNAVGLIRGLTAAGRTLPRDLAIVGFDDVTAAQHVVPNLSTVEGAFDEVGQEAGETLLAMLEGGDVPAGKRFAREGRSRLVVRQSCGCRPRQPGPDAASAPLRLAAENQYLEQALSSQYGISMELLRSEGNPADLGWLERSRATAGCLGLWLPDRTADPLLDIAGTYHRDPTRQLKPESPVTVDAFPPAELIDESDPGAGQIAFVVPVRLRDSDRGMLAHVGPIDTQKSSIVETVNQWAALLCGMLDHREVVTSLRRQEEQLRHAALYDQLTGLPNRTLFLERIGGALGRAGGGSGYRFGVLFLDLDGLKVINDSLGHLAGDRLLCQVAERIRAEVRPVDTPARFAGDEFAILVDGIGDPAALAAVAERLREAVGRPQMVAGQEVVVSVSIGIAEGTSDYQSAEDLLRNADIAMYRAKTRKKGSHAVFDVSMRAEAVDRLRIETELRQALADSRLELHYQPIVDLAAGTTVALEALLRWRHPTQGLLPPARFLPVAEEAGLMVPIGQWVIGEACRRLAGWRRAGTVPDDLWVSINLSDRQFWYGDAAATVAAALRQEELPAHCVALEITESVVVHDVGAARRMLHDLHGQGLKLYVDDFGTGYSSLSLLRELPIDALKIDKSFVNDVASSARARELIRTIILMGHNLGMGVIAEGIEDREQHAVLRELGCELGQGHLFSRPVHETAFGPRGHRGRRPR
ncbi:EAL domain-containing protein [Phytohabitans sp. LJ34]|uniref:EAL domain-containing protein n=1 Tax=Phytohabitans sp. LJ34 TaxID=3452217 RepID=UPI003F8BBC53